MTDTQMWEFVVAFLSATFVLPAIQRPRWSDRVRALVTFGYSVVVALGTAYLSDGFEGDHDVRTAVTSILMMLVAAIATYHGFAKPTGIAPAIETATTPERDRL